MNTLDDGGFAHSQSINRRLLLQKDQFKVHNISLLLQADGNTKSVSIGSFQLKSGDVWAFEE